MTASRRQACARAPRSYRRCCRRSQRADRELNETLTMRGSKRLIALAVVVALSGALAGCGGGGMSSFDPSDLLDFLDTKKKLPGERKPVFPEGVPGLEQGVPKNLYKGSRQEQIDQQTAEAAPAAAPPAQEPKSKRGAKGKKPAVAGRAPAPTPRRRPPTPMPRRGKRAAPPLPRPLPSGRSCAGAPRRRRPMRRPSPRSSRNNPRRHSRRRCRAARL